MGFLETFIMYCVFTTNSLCLCVRAHVDCAMVVIVVICSLSYSSWKFVVDVRLGNSSVVPTHQTIKGDGQDIEMNKRNP